jgi:hypothetical protein
MSRPSATAAVGPDELAAAPARRGGAQQQGEEARRGEATLGEAAAVGHSWPLGRAVPARLWRWRGRRESQRRITLRAGGPHVRRVQRGPEAVACLFVCLFVCLLVCLFAALLADLQCTAPSGRAGAVHTEPAVIASGTCQWVRVGARVRARVGTCAWVGASVPVRVGACGCVGGYACAWACVRACARLCLCCTCTRSLAGTQAISYSQYSLVAATVMPVV